MKRNYVLGVFVVIAVSVIFVLFEVSQKKAVALPVIPVPKVNVVTPDWPAEVNHDKG